MADIHRLPNIRDVERETSEWIARLNADDVSSEDHARFEAWLGSHPLHARTYEEMLGTWKQFTEAKPLDRAVEDAPSTERLRASYRPRRWQQWAIAVTGIVAAVLLGFHLNSLISAATFETALGERATISLPDGSTLVLNSGSRARVDYSLRSRVIHLERGEAFFKVAHDAARPFWVASGNSWVRAVGTAFGVYLNRSGVQVTVHEGTVKVGSAAHSLPTSLTAGEQADLEGSITKTRKLSAQELDRAAAWRDGWLYVENKRLCDVIAELNRYTPRQLVLEDAQLCSLSVGGAFQANPQGADALLSMLEQNFGARIRRSGDRAYIQGAPTPASSAPDVRL